MRLHCIASGSDRCAGCRFERQRVSERIGAGDGPGKLVAGVDDLSADAGVGIWDDASELDRVEGLPITTC